MRRMKAWVVAAWLLGALAPAAAADGYAFEFQSLRHNGALSARLKPMSSSIGLKATPSGPSQGRDHLQGVLRLGPEGSAPRRLVVSRTQAGEAYDLLLVDLDGDGSLDDETPIEARMNSSGKTIWSSFDLVLRIDHGRGGKSQVEEHAFLTYLAVTDKAATPDAFHYSSQGFRIGRVEIDKRVFDIVLTDRNNDGRYGNGDGWSMRGRDEPGRPEAGDAYAVGQSVEAGGRHWLLVLEDTGGHRARVVEGEGGAALPGAGPGEPADPGDGGLQLADTPMAFAETLDAGRAQAQKIQGPLFVSFESAASDESLAMREKVYGTKAVAAAAGGLSCARVDVDAHRELKSTHEIKVVPTGILLDPQGREVARFEGVQTVEEFTTFLAAVHPWLLPADDEPKLGSADRKRHEREVKDRVDYLDDNKHQGLLVDRIKDLGTQKFRAARDALIGFASKRKSKEYIAEAFFALARIGGRIGIEFLCGPKALASKDYLVAEQAAQALALARDPRAVDALLEVLTKRGTKIQILSSCCLALAQCAPEDKRVIQAVFEYAEHPKDTVRSGAAEALGYLKTDKAVDRLREMLLKDDNTRVRGAAATGIGHTGRTELVPLLRKAIAEDKGHTVRTAALEAIRELQGEKPATAR